MADRTEACPTASHQQRSGAPIAARSCGRVLSVARSHRLIRLMQPHKLRTLLCSQANHARTSQNIVSGRERAAATDVSRMVAVAHTTMNVGMDKTTKTINQPLVRNRSNTTLGEVVGKVGILSKPSARKQTHTASARQPQPMLDLPHWVFRGGLHRRLARPCSLNCVQTQTNH